MKAIVFKETGGPEVLALGEAPKPEVRPGMVLVKIHAIGDQLRRHPLPPGDVLGGAQAP